MKTFKQYLSENTQPTMELWHGGNLEHSFYDSITNKKGKYEYGPGLYLTTHYNTAIRYSKGSRKLYKVTINKGTNVDDVMLDTTVVYQFIDNNIPVKKRKDVKDRLTQHIKDNNINAGIFLNIMINGAIKPTNTNKLRLFLVNNGCDYSLVPNAFGWHEMMVVLFNTRKIIDVKRITTKDKITTFDLPTDFT